MNIIASVLTIRLLLTIALPVFLLAPYSAAQLPDAQPPIAYYESDIEAYPQNFAIAADNTGYVYIGNADGVLIYDGEEWRKVSLPNKDLVRSLAYDGKARVYVGGFDDFGYLEQTASGDFRYTSIADQFSDDLDGKPFADIWRIAVTRFGVFFVSLEHVFLYQPGTGNNRYWQHEDSFGPITEWRDRVYLQWRGQGIRSFDGADWTPHPHPALARDFLVNLLPMRDELIIVSNDGPWLRFRDGEYSDIPDSQRIPFKQSMTHGLAVDHEVIGVATQLGTIVFYNLQTKNTDVIQVTNGFVPDLTKTAQGYLLTVDDTGFSSLRWPTRWRAIDGRTGLVGNISAIRSIGDRTYVLTSSGVFASRTDRSEFDRLDWTDYEAWDLLDMGQDGVLLADSYEIKLISPEGDVEILDNDTTGRLFVRSHYNPDLVYVGTEYGLQILEREAAGWRSVVNKNDMTNLTVSHIVERAPGEVWIGSDRGGIYRLDLDFANWRIETTPIGEELGLHYDEQVSGAYVYNLGGTLVASTDRGLFRYDGHAFTPFALGNSEALQMPGRTLELATNDDQYWAFYYDRLFRLDESGTWREEDVSTLNKGGMTVLEFQNNRLLVGGLGSILTFNPVSAAPPEGQEQAQKQGQLKLTHVETGVTGGQPQRLPLKNIVISTADDRLTLRYALTEFARPDTVRYRTKLVPVEAVFSNWTDSGQQSLRNLSPGDYQLFIQAMSRGQPPVTLQVPVSVEPQWFQTAGFRTLISILLLLLVFLLARYLGSRRARVLQRENELLELKVTERTRALQSANQQLDHMAHRDGLTEIANRRRLDAYLEDVRQQCVDKQRVMALAIFDVDHFKRYNDSHGHQAGDALLIRLARLFSQNLRRTEDLVARYGGEEFVVVLPGADEAPAFAVVDNMRRSVERSDLGVTVSAGLYVHTPDEHTTVESMLQKADKALYEAKHGGRNRVVTA